MNAVTDNGGKREKAARIRVRRDDFIYACARAAARQARCFGKAGVARLVQADDYEAALRMLSESGFEIRRDEDGAVDVEGALDAYLERTLSDILSSVELFAGSDPSENKGALGVFDFLKYPYDCHNIKSAIKCAIRSQSPDALFIPLGTVDKERMEKMLQSGDFSALPAHMAEAADRARALYAASNDPRQIDLALDSACFSDMSDAVQRCNVPAFKRLVEVKSDLVNIMTFIRMSKMRSLFSFADIRENLVQGGSIPAECFVDAEGDEGRLVARLSAGIYAPLADFGEKKLYELERIADDIYISAVKEAAFGISYGPEAIAAFVIAREYEVKNIRIALAAKKAGLSSEEIKERLRDML